MHEPLIVACNFTVTLVHHVTLRIFFLSFRNWFWQTVQICCCNRNQLASGPSVIELEARCLDEQTDARLLRPRRGVLCAQNTTWFCVSVLVALGWLRGRAVLRHNSQFTRGFALADRAPPAGTGSASRALRHRAPPHAPAPHPHASARRAARSPKLMRDLYYTLVFLIALPTKSCALKNDYFVPELKLVEQK